METEITAQILCSREAATGILEKKGFYFKEKFLLIDHYFTHLKLEPDIEYKHLMENSFILRDAEFNRRYGGVSSSTLIYKDKLFDERGAIVGEAKKKCDVTCSHAAEEIFLMAGLTEWCLKSVNGYVFKKGEHEILLQEVDDLGLFLEIEEFESQHNEPEEKKIEELIKFAKALGLPLGDCFNVRISYLLFKKEMEIAQKAAEEAVKVDLKLVAEED